MAHSSTSAHATPHKLWYNIPYDGSDAYSLNVAIDPLTDALMCQEGLYLLLRFTHHRMESIISCAKITGVMKLHGLKGELKDMKMVVQRKLDLKEKLEQCAWQDGN